MSTKHQNQGQLIRVGQLFKLGLGVAIALGLTGGEPWFRYPIASFSPSVVAQELPGGISFFSSPPQLVDSASTFSEVSVPTPKYYFTIAMPADAGQGLAKVVFQRQASPDPIDFYPDRTEAFNGAPRSGSLRDRQNLGQGIPLQTTLWDNNTGLLTVSFAEPVAPGQTVTLRLIPRQNPDVPGTYQFRLLAFPPGDQAQSMDLGVARFQFYQGIW